MSQQLTITIPDALSERLKAVKQRFNVSGVCQNALESEVTKQELLMKEPKKMADIVTKLRAQKQEFEKPLRDAGYESGYESGKDMDYEDFMEVVKLNQAREEQNERDGEVPPISDDLAATSIYSSWLASHVEQEKLGYQMFDQDIYLEGFIAGVLAFWEEIKDKI